MVTVDVAVEALDVDVGGVGGVDVGVVGVNQRIKRLML